jgi:hypothetical protein
MGISRPTRILALVSVGILALGCSKESEPAPRLETTAATGSPGDSIGLKADTAPAAAQEPETSATKLAIPRGPVGHPTKKPGAGTASPASKPAPDTSASVQPRAESTAAPATTSTPQEGQEKWLSYEAATNTVTFELVGGPFTFNGYRNGEATLVVPSKASIVMNFINKDGTPHSAIIISGEGPIPNSASDPAIPRAYTSKVTEGMPQEATDVMRFPVPESGTYRIFCGVPGHGLSGMWIWMKVDPAAKTPSFGPTKG